MNWKRPLFIVCVVAAVLIHRTGITMLFGFAAFVAFANLISYQLSCALGSCSIRDEPPRATDPVRLASQVNRVTGFTGVVLLLYALVALYWN